MTQKVSLYGVVVDMTVSEAEGALSFLYGREAHQSECAPMGFATVPPDADDEWRRGYAMCAFAITNRQELQI